MLLTHSIGMDVSRGLFCFLASASRLMSGCWQSRLLLSGSFSQLITWCPSCFSMSHTSHGMSAFSGSLTSRSHSLSHPFLVLPTSLPTSKHSPKIFCAFSSVFFRYGRYVPKALPNDLVTCSQKLSQSSALLHFPWKIPSASTHPVFPVC